jgi:hypothetical protein
MQISIWPPDIPLTDDKESDAPWPESPEARSDRFGIGFSLLLLCVALAIMVIWLISAPSFEKCSALENQSERNICYEKLRDDLLKSPAKGANAPNLDKSN